jgi:16S rRNA (cytosine967-C5)-methyltransferase
VHKILAEQRIPLEMGDTLKMLPHKHGTDGFFAAVFERKASAAKAAPAESDDEVAE